MKNHWFKLVNNQNKMFQIQKNIDLTQIQICESNHRIIQNIEDLNQKQNNIINITENIKYNNQEIIYNDNIQLYKKNDEKKQYHQHLNNNDNEDNNNQHYYENLNNNNNDNEDNNNQHYYENLNNNNNDNEDNNNQHYYENLNNNNNNNEDNNNQHYYENLNNNNNNNNNNDINNSQQYYENVNNSNNNNNYNNNISIHQQNDDKQKYQSMIYLNNNNNNNRSINYNNNIQLYQQKDKKQQYESIIYKNNNQSYQQNENNKNYYRNIEIPKFIKNLNTSYKIQTFADLKKLQYQIPNINYGKILCRAEQTYCGYIWISNIERIIWFNDYNWNNNSLTFLNESIEYKKNRNFTRCKECRITYPYDIGDVVTFYVTQNRSKLIATNIIRYDKNIIYPIDIHRECTKCYCDQTTLN